MGPPDELLVSAMAGDRDALRQLLDRDLPKVRDALHGKIAACWQSLIGVDDVLQITAIDALLKFSGFRHVENKSILDWLMRAAKNNLRDAIRELEREKRPNPRHRVGTPNDGDSYDTLLNRVGVTTTTPSRLVTLEERKQHLHAALDTLPAAYAAAIRLYDLEERPIAEVAEMIGRSQGAVHMLRLRGHEQLFRIMVSMRDFRSRFPEETSQ